jgi:hypothetical protein
LLGSEIHVDELRLVHFENLSAHIQAFPIVVPENLVLVLSDIIEILVVHLEHFHLVPFKLLKLVSLILVVLHLHKVLPFPLLELVHLPLFLVVLLPVVLLVLIGSLGPRRH